MQYAKINGKVLSLKRSGFGDRPAYLHRHARSGIYELWQLYSSNNFDNPLAKADKALYEHERMKTDGVLGWSEITGDVIRNGGEGFRNGRLHVKYIANAGRPDEKITFVYAPQSGLMVPTNDGLFHEGTGIPFETLCIHDRERAIKRNEAKGIPREQVSCFNRTDSLFGDAFVSRNFDPGSIFGGPFTVNAYWTDSSSGGFGLCYRYVRKAKDSDTSNIVMEIKSKK